MTGGSFRYLVKQGLANLWFNRLMTVASVGILSACLILIGGASLISLNVRDILHNVEGQNEMRVFLFDEVTEDEKTSIEGRLSAMPSVSEFRFIGKEEALEEARRMLGDKASILDGYIDNNPVATSYIIKLGDISKTSEVQSELSSMPGVEQVNAMTEVVETLTGLERSLLIFGGIVVIVLVLASVVVIQNSIRLTVFARRREINIMKYVGATNGFIRLPFVVEGMAVGIIAAFLALLMIYLINNGVVRVFENSDIQWVASVADQLIPFSELWAYVAAGFFGGGVVLGAIGSGSAIRKYLKV
ncbi:MAG: permease-like cell division protein FtsX [Oscillospiraceae bacterium]|nr:permease-like cell division protein FtsX [Oscillospiraceae bacterium]